MKKIETVQELKEVQLSIGAEYWYAETFAARLGYFYEHESKGGRKYMTIGAGMKFSVFSVDISYLVPTTKISTNPLAHTLRIQLSADIKPTDKTAEDTSRP